MPITSWPAAVNWGTRWRPIAPEAPARSTRIGQRYWPVYYEVAENFDRPSCPLFGGMQIRYGVLVYALDEVTRQRFFALSLLVHDVDGSLAPAVLPGSL